MGYMIEITESKKEKLSEHIENALHEMGKAMACVEQFGSMGERGGERGGYGNRYDSGEYGMRESYGSRMGYRDEEEEFGERRGRRRDSRGRYM